MLIAAAVTLAGVAFGRAPVIVVDPGHGGAQEGAVGPGGEREKDLALQISRKLRAELQETLSAKVYLTRETDTDLRLSERVAWANRKRPDLFISVHMNAMPTQRMRARVHGIETYFLSASASGAEAASTADRENAEGGAEQAKPGDDVLAFILSDLQRAEAHSDSSRLAYAVHQELIAATRANNRGVQQAPFYVLNGLNAPAILVEVGYISHPTESKRLKDKAYQQKVVEAIAAGVGNFLAEIERRDTQRGRGVTSASP